MKVFKSECGVVTAARFLKHTPKGFKVEEDWGQGRKYETTWVKEPHRENYRSFLTEDQAKKDAIQWLLREERKCFEKLQKLEEKIKNLLAT